MPDHTAIGIDVGTTNAKVVLVEHDGTTAARAARPLGWHRSGKAAEQDADATWAAVVDALAELRVAAPNAWGRVGSIGLCAQYSSIVPVDAEARPVAPMRLYLDGRGTRHCLAILGRHEDALATWVERHPIPPVGGGLALGHLLAFQLDKPAVHAAVAAYLEPVDFVAARLTGRLVATQVSMYASQLIDNRALGTRTYDPALLERSGVDPERLPELVDPTVPLGRVRPEVAAALGLPEGVQVIPGITDSHAAALAAGLGVPGRVGLAVGTTAVLLTPVDHLVADLDHELLAMPGIDGRHLVSAENGLAGRAVAHVLEGFVHARDALGDHRATDPFDGFDEALAASPPGARGVRFLPWPAGSMAPQADPAMRGGFVGVSLDTERVDLVRAAAEGVAHNVRRLLGPLEVATAQAVDDIVLMGGAAQSRAWTQVFADVLDRPVRAVVEPGHAGARAVALRAAALVAGPGSVADPVAATGPVILPDPTTRTVHDAAHDTLVEVFDALRPLRLGRRG